MKVTIRIFVLLAALSACAVCPAQNKASKPNTQPLMDEAKTLEASEKYDAARTKYKEAAAQGNKTAGKELDRMNKQVAAKTKALVEQASKQHQSKDDAAALQSLEQAAALSPNSSGVVCNMPVVQESLGDKAKAIDSLDNCIQLTTNKDERLRLEQLRTQLLTGEKLPELNVLQKQELAKLNEEMSENARRVNPDPAEGEEKPFCERLLAQKDSLPNTASVLFNLAQCAESEGNVDEAARYMEQYLAAGSSEAGKDESSASSLEDLKELLAEQGEQADKVKAVYGQALKSINAGRLDKALVQFQDVVQINPNLTRAHWRLALFYEAMGDIDKAQAEFSQYQARVGDADKARAQEHVDALQERRQKYDGLMADIRQQLKTMATEREASTTIKDDLVPERNEELLRKLVQATELFPLEGEANQLLGFIYLQRDQASTARISFDALSLHSRAPYFNASVAEKGKKEPYNGTIQIRPDGIRILPVSQWDKKSKKNVKLDCGVKVEEGLGLATIDNCGEMIEIGSITNVEVKNWWIELKTANNMYTIVPSNPVTLATLTGGPSYRKYGNRYARLFTRYGGYDGTMLGKEGFTGREKFGMVMSVASVAAGGYSSIGSMTASSGMMMSAFVAINTLKVVQQSRLELKNMLQTDSWKAIPVNPAPLAFRLDLL